MGFIYVFILTWAMVDLLELYCTKSQSNQDSFNVSTQPHVILPLLRGVMFSSLSAGWVAFGGRMGTGPLNLLVWIWIKGQIQASLSFYVTLQLKVLLHIFTAK